MISWSSTLSALLSGSCASEALMSGSTSAVSESTIADIVVGAIVGFAILEAAVWFVIRRRKKRTVIIIAQQAPDTP